jgi:hypothetical protein
MPIISAPKTILSNLYRYGRIIPTGLIVHYDIQNTTSYSGSGSTITDLTRYSNTGDLSGAFTFDVSQNVRFLLFNGTNASPEYAVTSLSLKPYLYPSTTSANISVFLWVYLLGNGGILSEQGTIPVDTGWYDNQIELVDGSMNFAVWPHSAGKIVSTVATSLNQWYYVGFTYDSSTSLLAAYVNDTSAGTLSVIREPPTAVYNYFYTVGYSSISDLTTGTRQQGNFRFGALHIYNYPLTLREIRYNYYSTQGRYSIIVPGNATTTVSTTGSTAIPGVAGQDDAFGPIPTEAGFDYFFFGTNYGNAAGAPNGIYWNTNNVIGFGAGNNTINWVANTGRGVLCGNYDRRTDPNAYYFPVSTVGSYKILRCLMFFRNLYSSGGANEGQMAIRFVRNTSTGVQYIEYRIFKGSGGANGGAITTAGYGARPGANGGWNITNGTAFQDTFGNTYASTFPADNTSFVIQSDSLGNNWTFTNTSYLNI